MLGPAMLRCRPGTILTSHAGLVGPDRFIFAYSPVVNPVVNL
jgi:hypothetical protein